MLYIAAEEGVGDTLKTKMDQIGAYHPNLDVSGSMRTYDELQGYNFIFIDSITRLGYSPLDIEVLEKANPKTSFIYVSQVTKNGSARGTNEYVHNVDVVIEVPEPGKAIQYGRYNQGGQLNIFNL